MASNGFNSREMRQELVRRGVLSPDDKAPPPGQSAGKKPDLEGQWLATWQLLGYPEPDRQFRFHPDRQWRFDFAWPLARVAVECQGGIWVNGGHTRGRQYQRDRLKIWTAQTMGWIVCEVTDVKDTRLMADVREQIELRRAAKR